MVGLFLHSTYEIVGAVQCCSPAGAPTDSLMKGIPQWDWHQARCRCIEEVWFFFRIEPQGVKWLMQNMVWQWYEVAYLILSEWSEFPGSLVFWEETARYQSSMLVQIRSEASNAIRTLWITPSCLQEVRSPSHCWSRLGLGLSEFGITSLLGSI